MINRIASGLYGGSEVIRADDELSIDHDWGPGFIIWLDESDYEKHGKRLCEQINRDAPESFLGYSYTFFGEKKAGISVHSIDEFFKSTFGLCCPPDDPKDRFQVGKAQSLVGLESWLYFLRKSPVYYDPLGKYSARKEQFCVNPPDLRLRVIAAVCLSIWANGEYKFCKRFVYRRDELVIQICLGDFIRSTMRLCFLINHDFTPHAFWLPHEFRKLPNAGSLLSLINQLVGSIDLKEKADLIDGISNELRVKLHEEGLIDCAKAKYGLGYYEILSKIQDPWLRSANIITPER